MADLDLDAIAALRESRMFGVRAVLITPGQRDALVDEVRRLRAAIEDIPRHRQRTTPSGNRCADCIRPWPCPTEQARGDGDAVGDELEAPAYAQSVLPPEIAAQREKGWPDFHPETFCHRCGRRNINWWTTAEEWEAATANLPRKELEILCPQCFADMWEQETGERSAWQVRRG